MIRICTALPLACAALFGYAHASEQSGLLNRAVAQADQRRTEALAQTRTELTFADGSLVNNCNDYLLRIATSGIDESLDSQLAKSEYLICETLDLIGRSQPIVVAETDYGKRLADSLDLRTFPSSLHMRTDEKFHTLKVLARESLRVDSISATMDVPDWRYRLEVVAVRDINGNGTPDWIVWLSDEAKEGDYRGYATLVILDPDRERAFDASLYSAKLSAVR